MTPTPQGQAAEAWARLTLSAPERRRLLPVLRAAAMAIPIDDPTPTRSRLLAAVDALDRDLTLLLNLGCPVPGGHEPMADAVAILEGR